VVAVHVDRQVPAHESAVMNERVQDTATRAAVKDLEVAGFEGPLAARLYRAAVDGKRDILIVFFHGGGFVDGDLDESDSFLRRLADASGYPVVLSSTYTLAPVKPFPAAVEDAHAVVAGPGRTRRNSAGPASACWWPASRPAATWPRWPR
jgi:acetyl esterase/lipase